MPLSGGIQGEGDFRAEFIVRARFLRKKAAEIREIRQTELFARFIDRLKGTKDLDGTRLFDNCPVAGCSEVRTTCHFSQNRDPGTLPPRRELPPESSPPDSGSPKPTALPLTGRASFREISLAAPFLMGRS